MRKTYADGEWRLLLDDGSLGDSCEPPTAGEREVWRKDGQLREESHRCPQCSAAGTPTQTPGVWACKGMHTYRPPPGPAPSSAHLPESGSRIYKVITQRDEFFRSSFNPERLQSLLNQESGRGWRVVSMTASDVGSFLGSFWGKGGGAARQELIVLLEKVVE